MTVTQWPLVSVATVCLVVLSCNVGRTEDSDWSKHQAEYKNIAAPLLTKFCSECHSPENAEADIDLASLQQWEAVRSHSSVWVKVRAMLESGQMPPRGSKQLSDSERQQLANWIKSYLADEAKLIAGDPGPVVLRRLNNAEYTYTLRDLTGIGDLTPAAEFPVDGAAGEGFSNIGSALVMSPALVTKYLDAAKRVSEHLVLLPSGVRFARGTTRPEWTSETMDRIREIYARHTTAMEVRELALQEVRATTADGRRIPLDRYFSALLENREAIPAGQTTLAAIAAEKGLSEKYLGRLWACMNDKTPSLLLDMLRSQYQVEEKTPEGALRLATYVARWQSVLWKFNSVGQIGRMRGPQRWQEPVDPEFVTKELREKLPWPFGPRSPEQSPLGASTPMAPPVGDAANESFIRKSFTDFRELFPAAVCYSRIVPVDEVITIQLHYREDDQLSRLLLTSTEQAELDRLWSELEYITQNPLTLVDALEQLIQYATQDSDPTMFEPLREPFRKRADAFRRKLLDTELLHVAGVLRLAEQAWRRPLSDAERTGLSSLYVRFRGEEIPHDESVRLLFTRVLTSPAFLYRLETPPPGDKPAAVTDWELASRLSYFLWSSAPDEELTWLAKSGQLHRPEVLAAQVHRMRRDPKIRRLATEFGCQWLHVREFASRDEKSTSHFPTFSGLKQAMEEESVLFFTDFFQNDGSVLSMLESDHTYLNDALAGHYGIPGVAGAQWRRVEGVRKFARGGVLTQASTLATQSGASRTSPILRGNWISEVILGEKLPKPPKGVPPLPEELPQGLTERQLIERHSSDVACAKCHQRIDPFGFSLEGFDAIGRLRTSDESHHAIDSAAVLPDGTKLDGLAGLQNYLLHARRDDFVRQFCRKLLGYSLGRSVQLSDEPLLDTMVKSLSEREYRISAALELIVTSPQFLQIRGQSAPVDPD